RFAGANAAPAPRESGGRTTPKGALPHIFEKGFAGIYFENEVLQFHRATNNEQLATSNQQLATSNQQLATNNQ
ncbi:MAG: hypothetical protein IKZ27_00275, partial [Kiritimatiellae bacterium]|nr:hypothetical protein [Kiritimatiellia bacterium]